MKSLDYKEFQLGKMLFVLLVPFQTLMIYLFIRDLGEQPIEIAGFMVYNSIFLLIYLMFYGMTTVISDDRIKVLFGIGLIRKTIHIDKIVSMKSVENPWYTGLGIRIISNGMMYNIDGKHAVELKLKDANNVIRIGTRNSTQLKRKISKRMKG